MNLSFKQQQGFDSNQIVSRQKAVFLYNFTKHFDWPDKMKSGNFIIQVVGTNTSLNQELTKMAASKQVGNQKLEIKNSNNFDNQPHIVFILNDASDILKEVATKYKGKGSLIVTEKNGLAKAGAAINFVAIDNKLKFEYSKNNAVKEGLKTGDGLNSLAIVID